MVVSFLVHSCPVLTSCPPVLLPLKQPLKAPKKAAKWVWGCGAAVLPELVCMHARPLHGHGGAHVLLSGSLILVYEHLSCGVR